MRFAGLIAAIVVATLAAILVFRSISETPAPTAQTGQAMPQLKTVNIFVAARPIAIGSTITQDMLAIQPWPEHLMLPGFILAEGGGASAEPNIAEKATKALSSAKAPDNGAQSVVGTIARAPFQIQEPIIRSKLANPNDPNFLAGELPKGMRVITILTNETEGLAGFVFPGDHVDVILTHEVDKPKGSASSEHMETEKESVTETLLNNVTVLAVDQRASGMEATDKEGKLLIPRSVSLMVSPTDAQRIRLGQKVGTLTLSLRALADRESADPMTITNAGDITQYKGVAKKETTPGSEIVIYRGVLKENSETKPAPPATPILLDSRNLSNTGQQ